MSSDPFADQPQPQPGAAETDFFSGGAPSCAFSVIGASHQGIILEMQERQQIGVTSGLPETWPDGNPKQVLVITLQTDERNPDFDDDDGQRRLFVKKPGGMFAAIKAAAGKDRVCVGGTIAVKYVKDGKKTNPAHNAPKEFIAKYAPPGKSFASAASPAPQPASSMSFPSFAAVPASATWDFPQAVAEVAKHGVSQEQLVKYVQSSDIKDWDNVVCTALVKSWIRVFTKSTGDMFALPNGSSVNDAHPMHPDFIHFG